MLFVLTLYAGSAPALTTGEIKKCTGKRHACFQSNYSLLVDLNPSSIDECIDACGSGLATGRGINACTDDGCVSRCNVAFDLSGLMCG